MVIGNTPTYFSSPPPTLKNSPQINVFNVLSLTLYQLSSELISSSRVDIYSSERRLFSSSSTCNLKDLKQKETMHTKGDNSKCLPNDPVQTDKSYSTVSKNLFIFSRKCIDSETKLWNLVPNLSFFFHRHKVLCLSVLQTI